MSLWVPERGYKSRWKPPLGARINWGHPLARDLDFYAPLNEGAGLPYDLVSGIRATANSSAVWSVSPQGLAMDVLYQTAVALEWPLNSSFGTGDFTIAVMSNPTSTTDIGIDFSNGGGGNQWRLQPNYNGSGVSAGSYSFLTYGGAFVNAGADSLNQGRPTLWVGVRSGTNVYLYRDGRLANSGSGTSQNVTQSNGYQLGWDGNPYNAVGLRVFASAWTRALTASEVLQLYVNPYAFLEAP